MTQLLRTVIESIPAFSQQAAQSARARQDRLTKPTGSLGRLEDLSIRLAGITGQPLPEIDPAVIFVYAADHGVASRGVSAYPAEVTAQMALNYARGGAVINALAGQIGAQLLVADVGIKGDLPADLPVLHRKIRRGTADWTVEPAMSIAEAQAALDTGIQVFREAGPVGLAVIGEMGIGNTTTSAALAAVWTGRPAEILVGRGTGVDAAGYERKLAAVSAGLVRHGDSGDVLSTLASLGGLEIAAMAGTILAAAAARVPVLIDGFISSCAALCAVRLAPAAGYCLVASHQSSEPGHAVLLEELKLEPLLELGLRLGEGSGAALAVPLLRSSLAVLKEVATFDQAGVSDRDRDADPVAQM